MTFNGWLQIALYCAIIILLVKPFGGYMTRVFTGERTFLSPVLGPVERVFYRLCGVDEKREQNWVELCRRDADVQPGRLPEPLCADAPAGASAVQSAGQAAVEPGLAFNTAVSFVTNTNWQSYVPRDDHELSRPDGRAHGAQFRLGRDRHRARRRADPRLRAPLGRRRSAISGSI